MNTITTNVFTIAAAAISIATISYGSTTTSHGNMSHDVKMRSLQSIEMIFGPHYKSTLKAIRRFVGEETEQSDTATNIVRYSRSPAYLKTVGEPMPKEEWKRTFWVVEGDWIPSIGLTNGTNLCQTCRMRLRIPHVPLYIYAWLDLEKGDGFYCEKDGIRFRFDVKRLAKCCASTRTITYTSKADTSRQMKFPKYSVECITVCSNWKEFEDLGYWKEEQERKAKFMKWMKDKKRRIDSHEHPMANKSDDAGVGHCVK